MNATETVVDALAVARLVRLIQEDDVPVGPAREWVLDVFGEAKVTDLLTCVWCLSPWVAAGVALARHRFPRAWPVAARILAGSQVTGQLSQMGR